jgi:rubrerythrin
MLTGKEFVEKIVSENQALFEASKMNVKAYFDSKPSQEELVDHFIGRMVNERMNMVEISKQVAELGSDADPEELALLTKQAHDEAVHFRLVKEVIERIQGSEVNVAEAIAAEQAKPTAKGAALLDKYEASSDPMALAAYQLVAEGRAEAVWNQMAECIEDDFISRSYARIAKDEGFHAGIGGIKLAKLANSAEAQVKVQGLIEKMRKDLFEISCKNTVEVPAARKLVNEAYGW